MVTTALASARVKSLDSISACTMVVSGVTTEEPGGALSTPVNASPVLMSVPPVTIRVAALFCTKLRETFPVASVVPLGSPSSHLPFPFKSWNMVAPLM